MVNRRVLLGACATVALATALSISIVIALAGGCSPEKSGKNQSPQAAPVGWARAAGRPADVREPAVAGAFYPKDPQVLSKTIEQFLAGAHYKHFEHVRGLICPHAGYEYSGPVAASAFRLLIGRSYATVVVMGPSHHAAFKGVFLTRYGAWRTPLGEVAISERAGKLAGNPLFTVDQWQFAADRRPPAGAADTPETYEHSVEVEVPFLQKTLKDFQVLPLVFGDVDPAAAAKALADQVDDSTLVIASSDLSHYWDYTSAQIIDKKTVAAICDLDPEAGGTNSQLGSPCGYGPIHTLVHLARMKGWKARLLDLRNSGDTAGNKDRVVGYSAIVFYDGAEPPADVYSPDERKLLLELARKAVTARARNESSPEVDPATVPATLRENRAAFVTLTRDGQLRGCIGDVLPDQPLYLSVLKNGRQAAFDPRPYIPSVVPEELPRLRIEVSVLTEPQVLAFRSPEDLLAKLRPNLDGVILQVGGSQGLFLPQVWEQIPDKVAFMNELSSQKAHQPPDAWRKSGAVVRTFQVEAFDEEQKQ